jgi:MFS family permease
LIARSFYGLIPSAIIHPFMIGLAAPAHQSLISKAVPEDQRGIGFGLTWTSRGILSLPSPYIGGLLWDRFSPRTPFVLTIIGCILLSVLAFFKLKPPHKKGDCNPSARVC